MLLALMELKSSAGGGRDDKCDELTLVHPPCSYPQHLPSPAYRYHKYMFICCLFMSVSATGMQAPESLSDDIFICEMTWSLQCLEWYPVCGKCSVNVCE